MLPYRMYRLGTDDHFLGVVEFVAASDEDAKEIALRQAAGASFELWQFDRFIAKVVAEPEA